MRTSVFRRPLARICVAVAVLGAGFGSAVAASGSSRPDACTTQTVTDDRGNKVVITICHP